MQVEDVIAGLNSKWEAALSGRDIALANCQQEITLMERELSAARQNINELHAKVDGSEKGKKRGKRKSFRFVRKQI